MTVESLIEVLHGAVDDLQVDDILDVLWLATRERKLSLYAPTEQPIPDKAAEPIESGETSQKESPVEEPGDQRALEPEAMATHKLEDEVPVYASGAGNASEDTVPASPVALPAGFALTNRLALARALQPFRERWLSRRDGELDEERTVIATAEQRGQLQLVFRPRTERWFDVDLVVDDDLAMGIWRDTLRDFRQMLRETGAFRDVRSWQLRMPVNTTDEYAPVLVSSSGAQVSARALAGQSVRRLVFFATHGSSQPWLSGSNSRLLQDWAREACVVLLQPLDRDQWKRSLLGEPKISGYVHKPGDVTAALQVERPWWKLPDEPGTDVYIPVVALTPDSLANWAHMQMSRGRRALVYALDTSEAEFEETDTEQAEQDEDFDSMVAMLREASHESFRLAVYLSAGAFTIPVARLVQEAKFGSAARPQHLAEVLLSGLVFTRSSTNGPVDPNEVYYEFFPQAQQILRRSLRSADAELIAESLEQRISEYIEEIYGRSISFRALVADKDGKYDIPSWAQPFARLGLDLLDRSVPTQTVREEATPKPPDDDRMQTAAQLLKDFRIVNPPEVVVGTAQLATATPMGGMLDPRAIDPVLWGAILNSRLVQQNANGQWSFLPGLEPLLKRIVERELLHGISLLWVCDKSENIQNEVERFRVLGALVDITDSTEQALHLMEMEPRHVIISNMTRGEDPEAGFDLLRQFHKRGVGIPVIIYATRSATDPDSCEHALRAGAFACTNKLGELFELILEAIGRSARPSATTAREVRVLEVLRSIGIDHMRESNFLLDSPRLIGEEVFATQMDTQTAIENHLRVVQAFTASSVNQLIRVDGDALRVVAVVTDPEKKGMPYKAVDSEGLIARAARDAEVVWIPDVSRAVGYTPAVLTTRSALLLPLTYRTHVGVLGIVKIELDEVNALTESEISWLVKFCAPLAARAWIADGYTRPTTASEAEQEIDERKDAQHIPEMLDVEIPENPIVYHDNPSAKHGPWVVTRGSHQIHLPQRARMGRFLVTNAEFLSFVLDGGYKNLDFWVVPARRLIREGDDKVLCGNGKDVGPKNWPAPNMFNDGLEQFPIANLSYYEAKAYCAWLNETNPFNGLHWDLPHEDLWEFVARSSAGYLYPWGPSFEFNRCNSVEAGIGSVTSVDGFPDSACVTGCQDMVGNLWEHVEAGQPALPNRSVLRGGSFKNNAMEIQSIYRLINVMLHQRADDFGFRCILVPKRGDQKSHKIPIPPRRRIVR